MDLYKKKQKKLRQGDPENAGDCYTYLALKADTKLHLAHSAGKREQKTCDKLFQKLCVRCREPTVQEKATFISDGNEEYTNAIEKYYLTETINYGQLIKIRENGKVVDRIKKVVFGEVDWIETVYIERYNLTLRNGISRLIRKTICFSKEKIMFDDHLEIYQAYNNLIRKHSSLKRRTPCMAEGITDHIWTWEELLMFKVVINRY